MSEQRLIDANALKEEIGKFIGYLDEDMIYRIRVVIDNTPTVEQKYYERVVAQINPVIEARPQGEWKVNNYGEHICSNCGHYALSDEVSYNEYAEVLSDFCPNCGADMRGDNDDG